MKRWGIFFSILLILAGITYRAIHISRPDDQGASIEPGSRMPAAVTLTGLGLYYQYFNRICTSGFSQDVSEAQRAVVVQTMAGRDHRLWHYFWHTTRNTWHLLTPEQRRFFSSIDPLWQPPRLTGVPQELQPLSGSAADAYNPRMNNAGEDFFYMHHVMMTELAQNLAKAHLPCIAPWTSVPTKDDATWPVPDGNFPAPKDDDSYLRLDAWRVSFTTRSYHADKTLGEIGYLLETTLHNNMHRRWTTNNPPNNILRPQIDATTLANDALAPFDVASNDWLTDSYSASVNRTFWKIHGFVESIMFLWLAVHEYPDIQVACNGAPGCYEWKGTWAGAVPHSLVASASRSVASESSGPSHQHRESFESAFARKKSEFVTGVNDRDRGQPGGANDRGKTAEMNRRKKVIDDALVLMHKHSRMDRGVLTRERLRQTKDRVFDDPSEYVRWLDEQEARGGSK